MARLPVLKNTTERIVAAVAKMQAQPGQGGGR
jgi:hypothetical protein